MQPKSSQPESGGQCESAKNKKTRKQKRTPRKEARVSHGKKVTKLKSPSDTTIYAPALKQKRFPQGAPTDGEVFKPASPLHSRMEGFSPKGSIGEEEAAIHQYVNNIRANDFPGDQPGTSGTGATRGPANPGNFASQQHFVAQQQERARDRTNQVLLQAERQKATALAPEGTCLKVPDVDHNFNDDNPNNFCQVSCHVDMATTGKIMIGDFVEFAKLYPKNPNNIRSDAEEGRIELVSKAGKTYFIPQSSQDSFRINNVRAWEKAFRVYAAIYTRANPHRAAEIYQYVHTINLAAASFQWDNVAYYDYHFRKIMAKNPQRSWAKVNTQLWSLAMRDARPTEKFNVGYSNNPQNGQSSKKSSTDWREISCWRYNKNPVPVNQLNTAASNTAAPIVVISSTSIYHVLKGNATRVREQVMTRRQRNMINLRTFPGQPQ